MLHIFKFFPFLIDIDSETYVNWFVGYLKDPLVGIYLDTFRFAILPISDLLEKTQDGLTLNDIENIIFFILFVRFIILGLRYNLKTSFYITCIGLFAGYLWYRHLIDLISMYRSLLLKLPFLQKLGIEAAQLRSINQETLATDLKLQENFHWYNPGQILYHAFKNGILDIDTETGLRHYIDPISMFVSNLPEPIKSTGFSMYYKIYNNIIPKIFDICSKFWAQISGIAAYAVITRIGKRYCPYLIRWHWTLLIIIGMIEQIIIYFIYRAYYFQTFIIIPKMQADNDTLNLNLTLQFNILNVIIGGVVLTHIGFIIFGLLHAVCGQYFYVPFFVENTELHIGKRPMNSIYSGGQTAWQDPKEKNKNTFFPKLWYGWFGQGTKNTLQINKTFKKFLQKLFKKLKKYI